MANAVSRQSQHQPRHRMGYITVPQAQQEEEVQSEHLTRSGKPDRRYSEFRALPPPQEEAETRARTGEVINGIHYTIQGKVDRRFLHEREFDEQEIAQLELDYLKMKAGQ